jgi:putative transcriptional regulator
MDRSSRIKSRKYRSDAFESLHSAARGLYKVGAIDKATMRDFDLACLTPVEDLKPRAIRSIRSHARMSQTVFASALNVPTSLVSQWERGEKKPSGPSLKLLALVKNKGIDAIL